MKKTLGQSEIDALFATAKVVDEDGVADPKAERFQFDRSGQMTTEQMKAISTLNDLFARNITHALGAWLRAQFTVNLISGEQMTYGEFIERVPEISYLCSMRLEPLDTVGLAQFDLSLAAPIVDLLLGGVGRAGVLREPTEIEDQILLSVMAIVTRELNVAWKTVGLQFSLERRESESEVVRLIAASEKVMCVCFEVRMLEATGSINLCLPAIVLNTILRNLTGERPRRRPSEMRVRLASLADDFRFVASMQFPVMQLPAEELADLSPGQVIRLPISSRSPAELTVGGVPIFIAQAVRSGDHRGAQLVGHSRHHDGTLAG